MSESTSHQNNQIQTDGFSVLSDVFSYDEVTELLGTVEDTIQNGSDGNIKSSLGETYAARNLADLNPEILSLWQKPVLIELLREVLGHDAGLVRVLYFDKHPNRTWSLPWHKDLTIAVQDNSLPTNHFSKPTRKSGVDHVEGSTEILANMLTLRIHLDHVTQDNGPLVVAATSHLDGKQTCEYHDERTILVNAGDVLAMRPLLSHASGSSTPGTTQHRRILHLEFSGDPKLPDGFEWHWFSGVACLH